MRWWCITPLFAFIAAEAQSTSSLGLSKFLTGVELWKYQVKVADKKNVL